MRLTIRDLFWTTVVVALSIGWFITSRRQTVFTASLQRRVLTLETRCAEQERLAQRQRSTHLVSSERAMQRLHSQYAEILELRHLLKDSLDDQREWFELEVSANRLIAIGPGTRHSTPVTADVIHEVQRATGLDGSRLLHFMTPISDLQLNAQGNRSEKPSSRIVPEN